MNRIIEEINRACYYNGNLYRCEWKPHHFSGKTHRGYCYCNTKTTFRLCDSCKNHADALMTKLRNRDLVLLTLTIQEREISALKKRLAKKQKKGIRTPLTSDQEPGLVEQDFIPDIIPDLFEDFEHENYDETTRLLPEKTQLKNEVEMIRLK